jgi:hypothetical protein
MTLMGEIAPAVGDDYVQRNTLLMAMLLNWVGEEWNRAAERRVRENREVRSLFAECVEAVEDADLRARLEAASQETDSDLTIEALDRSNDALRGLLIEFHAHVETLGTPAARQIEAGIWRELRASTIEAGIWRELRASTERRALSGTPF